MYSKYRYREPAQDESGGRGMALGAGVLEKSEISRDVRHGGANLFLVVTSIMLKSWVLFDVLHPLRLLTLWQDSLIISMEMLVSSGPSR